MMVILNKYEIQDFVYLTTDREQQKRIVTGIQICSKNGEIVYYLNCGTIESKHYEFEISAEKNLIDAI